MSAKMYVVAEGKRKRERGRETKTDEEISEGSRRRKREENARGEGERGETIPCAHDGTKMQSPGINEEETRSCWSKFSRRGWE